MSKKIALRTLAVVALVVPSLALAYEEGEVYQPGNEGEYTEDLTNSTTYVVDPARYPEVVYPQGYVMNDTYPWDTTVVPFDPARIYTAAEQDSVVNSEAALLNNSPVYYDSVTGLRDVDYNQATIPEATQEDVVNSPDIDEMADTASVFHRAYTRTERFGNSTFGAGYYLNAYITATTGSPKKLEGLADGRVYGKAFGYERTVTRGRAYIRGQSGNSTGSMTLYAMGQAVWSRNLVASFSSNPVNWSRKFFSVKRWFTVGPVPVLVTARLNGGIKVDVYGSVGATVASMTLKPGGWAQINASASVNIVVAAVGVSSNLTLVNVTLPAVASLSWPSCTLTWKLKADLSLKSMSGTVWVWAKLRFIFYTKTYKVTIASWGGIYRAYTLKNIYGSFRFGC